MALCVFDPAGSPPGSTFAQMVGHTDMKMIEQRYGHLYESAAQKEIDRIDQVR
jgi:hypothetical protein